MVQRPRVVKRAQTLVLSQSRETTQTSSKRLALVGDVRNLKNQAVVLCRSRHDSNPATNETVYFHHFLQTLDDNVIVTIYLLTRGKVGKEQIKNKKIICQL